MNKSVHIVNYSRLQIIDFFRNLFMGSLIPITEVILMLIFIKKFDAGLWEKTTLIVLLKTSFLVGIPLSLYFFSKKFILNYCLIFIFALSAVALFISYWVSASIVFLLLAVFIAFPINGIHPLLSEVYSLYPATSRAKRFVSSNIGLFLGSIIFAAIYNWILDAKPQITNFDTSRLSNLDDPYFYIFLVAIISILISGFFFKKMPLVSFTGKASPKWSTLWQILKTDKFFLYVVFIWNLFGFANLWLVSFRTNVLVESEFGFNYDVKTVLFLLVILPEIAYVLANFPFAYLFDKFNFVILRIFFNLLMIFYIYFFFFGDNYSDHIIGGICFGMFRAGGNLAWRLWINKMVDVNKVSLYSTIHIGITGIRMVLAPIIGLYALYHFGPKESATVSLILIMLSIIMLIPLIPKGNKRFNN